MHSVSWNCNCDLLLSSTVCICYLANDCHILPCTGTSSSSIVTVWLILIFTIFLFSLFFSALLLMSFSRYCLCFQISLLLGVLFFSLLSPLFYAEKTRKMYSHIYMQTHTSSCPDRRLGWLRKSEEDTGRG